MSVQGTSFNWQGGGFGFSVRQSAHPTLASKQGKDISSRFQKLGEAYFPTSGDGTPFRAALLVKIANDHVEGVLRLSLSVTVTR
jgi:hypothetical protein